MMASPCLRKRRSRRRTVGEVWAPRFSQNSTRAVSTRNATSFWEAIGLENPTRSMKRPSRGDALSATTML